MSTTITLYRPVGTEELVLIEASGGREFPPRLPEQPIFYPVTNEHYARQIARDWNAQHNSDHKGYVTRFEVPVDFINAYERRVVGGREHEEFWVPAEDLGIFNAALVGPIEVIATYVGGDRFGLDGDEYEYVLNLANHAANGAWADEPETRKQSRLFLANELSADERRWIIGELLRLAARDPNHVWEAPTLTGMPTAFAETAFSKVSGCLPEVSR